MSGRMEGPVGAYLHLPFCEHKCAYCDFPSFAGQAHRRGDYTRALVAEIRARAAELGPVAIDTVFLGGGTPSLMEAGQIRDILGALKDGFQVLPDAEITSEANPGTLTRPFLEALRAAGGNRLSLGAQSAHEAELRLLERIHDWDAVRASVELARDAGFQNINLDLMTALPGQDWGRLRQTLEKALALSPEHLSCYSLIIEEGTPFFERHARGELPLPDEDKERRMYRDTVRLLADRGYPRYEISNHARPGFACRHNLNCWRYHDYLGFGLSAAGLYRGVRRKNAVGLEAYLAGAAPQVETLGAADQRFEMLMLALRMDEGLDPQAFEARFGVSPAAAWPEALPKHLAGGLLEWAGGRLRLTPLGFDLMDRALLDFLPETG